VRAVVAHDYFTQRGGAERVALVIAESVSAEEVVTAVCSEQATFEGVSRFIVKQSVLGRVPIFRRDPRLAFPLLSWAWDRLSPVNADILVASSSGWAHGLRVTPETKKIVYCHNPPRWLYQADDYLLDQPFQVRVLLRLLTPILRRWDKRAALTADAYVANSTSVANRIEEAYGITARVLYPPVSLDTEGAQSPIEGHAPGYFLTVGRSRGYKSTQLLIDAFDDLPDHRLLVVGMDDVEKRPTNVFPLGKVSDDELRWLYSNARALLSVSREDFGLTPVEANAFGTPSLVLKAGGFLDSTKEHVSGEFIPAADLPSVLAAVREFPEDWDREAIKRHAQQFSRENFGTRLNEIVNQILAQE